MVNVGLSWSSMVGIALAIAGAALYFLRSVRPGLARDHDIFFAAVSLLCGGILFFQGWRQDPILQFGQFLLAGSAIFFAVESIRLRGVATEQAKRTTPIVDDERPVSRVYRAELDDYDTLDEDRPVTRRIRGTRDSRPSRIDDYEDEAPRRRPIRPSSDERLGSGDRPRRRRPRPDSPISEGPGGFSSDISDVDIDERPSRPPRSSNGGPSRPSREPNGSASRSRRSRPAASGPANPRRPDLDAESADYVDYQPVNYSDEEDDNSANFD